MLCFPRYYDSHPLLPAPSPFMPPLGFQQRQRTSFAAPVAGPDTFYSNRAYSFSHFEFSHSSHPPLRICNTHASVMYASGNSQGAQSCRSMHRLVPPRHCSKCQSAAICTVPATAQSQRHHRQLREVRAQQRDERRGEQRTAGAALDAVGSTLHAGGTARTNRVQLQRFVLTEGAARKASHMHGATVWAAGALCRPQTVQHAAPLGSRSAHHVLGLEHCWLRNGLRLPLAARLGCKPHGQVAARATGSGGEPAGNDAHTAASEPGAAAGSSSLIPVEVIVPYCPLQFGEQLSLVGSCAELGAWDASAAPLLQWQEGDDWAATLSLPPGEHTCKLVLVRQDGSLHWEEGEDRAISIPANASSAALAMRFGITAATEVRTVPRTATAGAEPVGQLRVAPGPSTVTEAPPPAAAAPAPPTAEPWAPAEQLEHGVMEGALGGEPPVAGEAYSPEAYPAEAYLPEAGLVEPAVEPASAAQVQQLAQAKLELSARILALQEEVQQSEAQIASRRRQVQETVQSELARMSGGQPPEGAPPAPVAGQAHQPEPAAVPSEPAAPGSEAATEWAAESGEGWAVPAAETAGQQAAAAAAAEQAAHDVAGTAATPDAGVPASGSASAPALERSPSPRPASFQERQRLQEAAARAAAAAAAAAARLQKAAAVARGAAIQGAARAQPPPPVQAQPEPEPFVQSEAEPEPFMQAQAEPEPFVQAQAEPEPVQLEVDEEPSPHWQAVEGLPAPELAEQAAAYTTTAEALPAAAAAAAGSAAAEGGAVAAPTPGVQASADDGVVVFSFDAAAPQRSAQELAQQLLQLPPEVAAALERRLRPGSSHAQQSSNGSVSAGQAALPATEAPQPGSGGTPSRDVQASAIGRRGRGRRPAPGAAGSRSGSASRGGLGGAPLAAAPRSRRAGLLGAARAAGSGHAVVASRSAPGEDEEEAQQADKPSQQQQVKAGSVSVPAQVPPPPAEAPPAAAEGSGAASDVPPTRPPPAMAPRSPLAVETPLAAEKPPAQQEQPEEVVRLFDVSPEGPSPPQQQSQGAGGDMVRLFDSGAAAGQPPAPAASPRKLPLSWSYPASPGWALEDEAFRRPSAPLACLFLAGEAAFGAAHLLWDTGRSVVPPGPARVAADIAFWAAAGAALAAPWL
ncbi:hypothetical protein ABPG77_005062 [Micractinium sp. CCAP 211/92]